MFAFIIIIFIVLMLSMIQYKRHQIPSKLMNISRKINVKHNIYTVHRKFSKTQFNIHTDDTVIFTNKDIVRHQIINDHASIPNSSLLYPGDSFEITFRNAGKYIFYSPLYNEMDQCTIYCQ